MMALNWCGVFREKGIALSLRARKLAHDPLTQQCVRCEDGFHGFWMACEMRNEAGGDFC